MTTPGAAAPPVSRTVAVVAAILGGLLVAVAAPHLPGAGARWLLAAAAVPVVALLVHRTRTPGLLLALVLLTTTGAYRTTLGSVAGFQVRVTDVPYVLLVVLILFDDRRRSIRLRPVGLSWLIVLLGAWGFSLYPVVVRGGTATTTEMIGWLRLVQTVSIAWLVPRALPRERPREFLIATLEIGAAVELARSLILAIIHGTLVSSRLRGASGPDIEGLIAALLIVTVVLNRFPTARSSRFALLALGVVGLVATRSVGGIVACCVGLGLFLASRRTRVRRRPALAARPLALLLAIGMAVAVAALVRPGSLPGSKGFQKSTGMHRVIVGTAGLEIFARHPITGVGWQRSTDPNTIGDPTIVASLRRLYPDVPRDRFPDVNPATVHDAYIQILADTGLVGLAASVVVAGALQSRIRRELRRARRDPETYFFLRWATACLIVVLVWWNDNPFFGAQPETVVAALMLGILAAPGVRSRRRPAPPGADDAPAEPVSRAARPALLATPVPVPAR